MVRWFQGLFLASMIILSSLSNETPENKRSGPKKIEQLGEEARAWAARGQYATIEGQSIFYLQHPHRAPQGGASPFRFFAETRLLACRCRPECKALRDADHCARARFSHELL